MKRITFYLVFLLCIGLFSSAKQQNTSCDKIPASRIVIEQSGKQSSYAETSLSFGPMGFYLAGF
jgi:hypothetical protein